MSCMPCFDMPYGTSRPITGKDTAPRSERVTLAQSTTLRLQQRLSCTMSAMTRSPLTRESIKSGTIVSYFVYFGAIVSNFCQYIVYLDGMKPYPHLLESTGITIEKNPKRTKDDQNGPRGLFGFAGLLCPWNHKRKKESHQSPRSIPSVKPLAFLLWSFSRG